MIQRIQTIYLIIGAVACILLLNTFFALGSLSDDAPVVLEAASGTTFDDGKFTISDNVVILAITCLASLLAILSIFLYRKRSLQAQLTSFFILLAVVINGLGFYLMYQDLLQVQENIQTSFQVTLGSFLPAIALICGFLALKGIRKDDKIVKSMDRLR